MSGEVCSSYDGVAIARSVRELAHRAHVALAQRSSEAEAFELFEAIRRLEAQMETRNSGDLGRWLSSLRRRVEAGLPAAV